jgi:hypothetical protein
MFARVLPLSLRVSRSLRVSAFLSGHDQRQHLTEAMKANATKEVVQELFQELNASKTGHLTPKEWRGFILNLREVGFLNFDKVIV